MSKPPAVPKGMVPAKAPDGSIVYVPDNAAALEQAAEAGATPATPEELKRAQYEAKYGGALDVVGAGAAGAARGLTLGLSDLAATELGGESVREQLEAYKLIHPGASLGGEVAGMLAPMLATGGAGGVVRGLGALPRAVVGLGEGAELVTAGALGAGRLGRVGGAVARGAVEGGFYGAGSAVSEAALGDEQITTERLLAGAKGGALYGALAGGALGLGQELVLGLRTPAPRDLEAVAGRHLDDATPGLGKQITEHVAAEPTGDPTSWGNVWKNRERIFGNHEEALERATRDLGEKMNVALKAERAVDMASFGEAKAAQMAKLVPTENAAAARKAAQGVWEDATATLAELAADPTRGGGGVAVGRAQKWLQKFGAQIDMDPKASDLFMQLDDFKRAMGDGAQFGKGPFGMSEAAREFDALYHRTKDVLENEEVWGKAGAAQREINVATQGRLATRKQFSQTFTTQYGSTAGRPEYVASPESLNAYVKSLTSAKNDLKHQALQDYIANEERFLGAVEKHYSLGPAEKKQIAEARKAFASMRETIDTTAKDVSTINQVRKLKSEETAEGVGGLLGMAFTPYKNLERLAAIESRVRSGRETMGKAVAGFFDSSPKGSVATPAKETSRARYNEVSKQVAELSTNPEMLSARSSALAQEIADHAPKTAARLGMLTSTAVTFLASKLPPKNGDPLSLTPQLERDRASDAEVARFMRYVRAVNDPGTVSEDLRKGRLTREAVEAVKVVYPGIYKELQTSTMEHLTEQKKPLPYQKTLQLGILLDIESHGSLRGDVLKQLQDLHAQQPEEPKVPGGSAFRLSATHQTAADRVEAR